VVCIITCSRVNRCSARGNEPMRWMGCGKGFGNLGISSNDLGGYSGAWKGV
jgi:hypothetical protein